MKSRPSVSRRLFGALPDGSRIDEYRLDNGNGLSIAVLTFGGIIRSVEVPDRDGLCAEVTLSHDTLEAFLAGHPYYGALVGRVANRISGGGFSIDGDWYPLATDSEGLHLHGGSPGFHERVYHADSGSDDSSAWLLLSRTSPDGEAGYPGTLEVEHRIAVHDDMRMVLDFAASTDRPTVVNLTNHCYWNLGASPRILDHHIRLNSDAVAEVENLIPTGRMIPVQGTPLDFRTLRSVEPGFRAMRNAGDEGFDHSYMITGWSAEDQSVLNDAAEVRCDATGRGMRVRTTYPDVHFYTGNHLPGERGRSGEVLAGQEALCLECQFFPDSPNRPEFPSVVLRPGDRYQHRTEHEFFTF